VRTGSRVVGAAERVLPGALAAWLVTLASALVGAHRLPTTEGILVAAGVLAAWTWPVFAVFATITSLRVADARPPVRPSRASAWIVLAALAVTASAFWPAHLAAGAIVPQSVSFRDAFVTVGAGALAGLLGVVAGLGVARRLGPPGAGVALWVVAPVAVACRVALADALASVFFRWEDLLDGASLVVLTGALTLPAASRVAWQRRVTLAGGLLCTLAVAALVALDGGGHVARESLRDRLPGASALLADLRGLYDLDGDGYSAVLGGADCDDTDPDVSPRAVEIVGNGLDDNCAGGELAAVAGGAGETPTPVAGGARRSVLIVTVDSLRADALAPRSGARPPTMPNLLAFAERGAWFANAYSPAPFTDDAVAGLMTGREPTRIRAGGRLIALDPTLAELLLARGWRTVALLAVPDLPPSVGRGFARVDATLAEAHRGFAGRTAEQLTDLAVATLETLRSAGEPYLLWVHYMDPHLDYLPREGTPFAGTGRRDRYRQEVWATDRALGRLLDAAAGAGLVEDGLVVVTGDHGEALGEKGHLAHALWMDEVVLRVPLVLAGAGIPATRIATRVRLIDVAPTVLDVAGGLDAAVDGRTLATTWRGDEPDRDVVAQSVFRGLAVRAVLRGRYKLVRYVELSTDLLYDLTVDPAEAVNLVDVRPGLADELRTWMGRRWDRALNDVELGRRIRSARRRGVDTTEAEAVLSEILASRCRRGDTTACDVRG